MMKTKLNIGRLGLEGLLKSVRLGSTVLAGGAALLLGTCSIHKTDTTEIGVRTRAINVFGAVGIEQRTYQPGATYFFLPIPFNHWHTFDTKLVNIEMTKSSGGSRQGNDELKFKTSDGNDVGLDITFSYRIDPERAPYVVHNVAQSDDELRDKIVRTVTRSRTRDLFGEITTQQFYNAAQRRQAADRAKEARQDILGEYGVTVENVDPQNFRWENADYANSIRRLQLAEADSATGVSQIQAQIELNSRLYQQADSTARQDMERADGAFRRDSVGADGRYLARVQEAGAITTEGRNESAAIVAARRAMASAGGRTNVQMAIAEAIAGIPIIMVPSTGGNGTGAFSINSFDVNEYLQTVGLQGLIRDQRAKADSTSD